MNEKSDPHAKWAPITDADVEVLLAPLTRSAYDHYGYTGQLPEEDPWQRMLRQPAAATLRHVLQYVAHEAQKHKLMDGEKAAAKRWQEALDALLATWGAHPETTPAYPPGFPLPYPAPGTERPHSADGVYAAVQRWRDDIERDITRPERYASTFYCAGCNQSVRLPIAWLHTGPEMLRRLHVCGLTLHTDGGLDDPAGFFCRTCRPRSVAPGEEPSDAHVRVAAQVLRFTQDEPRPERAFGDHLRKTCPAEVAALMSQVLGTQETLYTRWHSDKTVYHLLQTGEACGALWRTTSGAYNQPTGLRGNHWEIHRAMLRDLEQRKGPISLDEFTARVPSLIYDDPCGPWSVMWVLARLVAGGAVEAVPGGWQLTA